MKYLKKYESFYNEDFKVIKEELGKRESEEDEKDGDEGFTSKDDKTVSVDIPKEVETTSMSDSEGGSVQTTTQISETPKEVTTSTFESNEETGDCEECDEETGEETGEMTVSDIEEEVIEEGALRKWATGHDSVEDKEEKKEKFTKELDKLDSEGASDNPKIVYNRAAIEKKAKENNYKGGIRVAKGGRDKSKVYVVYDDGFSGFQSLAGGASGGMKKVVG